MKRLMFTFVAIILALGIAVAGDYKIPLIGSKAPKFSANTTEGKITFPNDFGNNWKILFSHPADFTPVCSSELLELAHLQSDFKKLGVQVAVISTDNVELHKMWEAHLEELDYKNRGPIAIEFPIFEDPDGKNSKLYGMLHEPTSTNRDIRGVFIIDDKNIVRSVNFYPVEVGRDMTEFVRIVEALQLSDKQHVYTPANWESGDDVIVPYFPYTQAELAANPGLKDDYYQVGDRIWFKRMEGNTVHK
ncbi:redoxin domain-containing protein [Draconibacterium sp. IB214405]|uniref:redoxin domain-containing protein n=1 Tax=Draconibacterium sp. IB214405 TaxID=3097352 RepID=UPI002A10BECA|nr:redoxin domain-containing protein [Draconibacterium sp. IB214405]MDX8341374.1 redoxin domain-containing protein [Draconibacterium sp. IB214405]